jgi:hypothetical protein
MIINIVFLGVNKFSMKSQRQDNQEALDKIKRKLSAGHKKLHWIKTADSKGNVFLQITRRRSRSRIRFRRW